MPIPKMGNAPECSGKKDKWNKPSDKRNEKQNYAYKYSDKRSKPIYDFSFENLSLDHRSKGNNPKNSSK